MGLLSWLTDRLILRSSRHDIHAPDKNPARLLHGDGELEVWVHRIGLDTQGTPDLYLLEFPGTASRAEHKTDFVEDCWSQGCIEIWAVNPPGYGNSSGTASLKKLPAMAERALQEVRRVAGKTPVIVAGGSLGSVSALYLAARYPISGLLVQNPPDLRAVILAQSGWWHFKWLARMIADQVPCELDSIKNAQRVTAPAVFFTARQDEVVFPHIQDKIIAAYNGPLKIYTMPNATHDTPLMNKDLEQLRPLVNWLYDLATH